MVTFSQLGKHGEFGNQLFQIAATIGHAFNVKDDAIFPKWVGLLSNDDYAKYFQYPILENPNLKVPKQLYSEKSFDFNEIPQVKDLDLFGYFQSERYFENCKDIILKAFTPNENLFRHLNILDYKNSVCVQLRFYDNKRPYSTGVFTPDPKDNNFYYTPEDNIQYYKHAINYFGYKKNYIVITNNTEKARQMFGEYTNFYFFENYNYLDQFFIQTKCEHNIISNSSFGWWGAWLNKNPDKVVFAPKNWFKNDMPIKDLYPEGWKVI